jgi:hypothetical protein
MRTYTRPCTRVYIHAYTHAHIQAHGDSVAAHLTSHAPVSCLRTHIPVHVMYEQLANARLTDMYMRVGVHACAF